MALAQGETNEQHGDNPGRNRKTGRILVDVPAALLHELFGVLQDRRAQGAICCKVRTGKYLSTQGGTSPAAEVASPRHVANGT